MIELKHVTKVYGDKKALDNVSLTIDSGKIYGLIGHNGAGKSTAIKILVSIINPTSGQVSFDGLPLTEEREKIKKRIGYVGDSPDLFLNLKASEYWKLMAVAYELDQTDYEKRLTYFMDLFNLTDHKDDLIDTFSHGMRQKTFIIGALLSNPDIWILDEPMTGLDPQASYDLKEMMRKHADAGNIVLFSTHVLEVAEELCDNIAILRKGQVLYEGTMDQLLADHDGENLERIYLNVAGRTADQLEEAELAFIHQKEGDQDENSGR